MASEHFYFWLNSLKEFSQAEQCLSRVADGDYSGAMSAIADALRSYQKGIASLTVSWRSGVCKNSPPAGFSEITECFGWNDCACYEAGELADVLAAQAKLQLH